MRPPDWRRLRGLAENTVFRLTALFPIVGYIILFFPAVVDSLPQPPLGGYFPLFSPKYRLYLLYYGLFSIGLSSLLMLRMPQMFRLYASADEFADLRTADSGSRVDMFLDECGRLAEFAATVRHIPEGERIILEDALANANAKGKSELRQLYLSYYNINSYIHPRYRGAIIAFFAVGICLLGILSLDTIAAVSERLVRDLSAVI